jgi:hypothetical protein
MKSKISRKPLWMFSGLIMLVLSIVLAACGNSGSPTPTGDPIEQAMQTLQAQATQQYFQTVVAQLSATPPLIENTPTLNPTNINQVPVESTPTKEAPTATATQIPPTATQPAPTAIPPTPTRIPPTPTPIPCYQVKFVQDITIPDGTKIVAGNTFTKTWRIRNSGSCTWDTRFDIAFVSGTQLTSGTVWDLTKEVKPGETVDISINMTAPATVGSYQANFQMVNPNGVRFGTGPDSKGSFWVKIQVTDGKGMVYNFADNACDARWSTSETNPLTCPGKETDIDKGYVLTKDNPLREDGGKENEIGLITRPNDDSDGYIQGIYPAFLVKDGDQFRATIQCEANSPKCSLKFELYYRVGSGSFVELGEWHEIYDQLWNPLEIDLSSLAGQNVQFSLVVWNEGTSQDNRGLWLNPMIYRTK